MLIVFLMLPSLMVWIANHISKGCFMNMDIRNCFSKDILHKHSNKNRCVKHSKYYYFLRYFLAFLGSLLDRTNEEFDRKWGQKRDWHVAKGHRVESNPGPLQREHSLCIRSTTELPGRPDAQNVWIKLHINAWVKFNSVFEIVKTSFNKWTRNIVKA